MVLIVKFARVLKHTSGLVKQTKNLKNLRQFSLSTVFNAGERVQEKIKKNKLIIYAIDEMHRYNNTAIATADFSSDF